MTDYDVDFFVIGAGSGGVRAARMAASYGARVAIAEESAYGGTCVNVGCVPKKLFVYASHYGEDFVDAAGFGWQVGNRRFDWKTLIANKNREIKRLNGVYARLLNDTGVTIHDHRATLLDAHTLKVGDQTVTAKTILLATGGKPVVPGFPGSEHVITSNEAFFLPELPDRIVIVGGGYIAVEFAGIFNGLGVDTTLMYRGPLFLRGFDQDIRTALATEMGKHGIKLMFDSNIAAIEKQPDGLHATLEDAQTINTHTVMYATGRAPNVQGLGLETVGVQTNKKGAIVVDKNYQTTVPSIYAIGDVTDRVNLTPVALAEGMVLAKALFKDESGQVDYSNIPTAVFSQPNIGTVGLTEEEARQQYDEVAIYRSSFRPMKHTMSGRNEKTTMKMIVNKKTDRVLGVHMLGADAGEIIQGIAIAMKAGATKAMFDSTVGIHPTAAEEFVTMREPVAD